jgi:hypothetical protein
MILVVYKMMKNQTISILLLINKLSRISWRSTLRVKIVIE